MEHITLPVIGVAILGVVVIAIMIAIQVRSHRDR